MFICNVVGYLSLCLSRLSRVSTFVELCGDLTAVRLVTASQHQQAPIQMPLSVNLSAEVINVRCQLAMSGVPEAPVSFDCRACRSSELVECAVDNQTRMEKEP